MVDFPTGLARGSRSSHFTVSDVSSSLLGSPALGSVGSFFLPLPSNVEEPPHTYLFVAMEPSSNWLRTEAEGRRKTSVRTRCAQTDQERALNTDCRMTTAHNQGGVESVDSGANCLFPQRVGQPKTEVDVRYYEDGDLI